MLSYVDAGRGGSLPRYGEVPSLEVVHCGATEPRPGGLVKPPAFRRLAGAPMGRDVTRLSTRTPVPTPANDISLHRDESSPCIPSPSDKVLLPGRILLTKLLGDECCRPDNCQLQEREGRHGLPGPSRLCASRNAGLVARWTNTHQPSLYIVTPLHMFSNVKDHI